MLPAYLADYPTLQTRVCAYIPVPLLNMMPEQKLRILCLIGIATMVILYVTMECTEKYALCFDKIPVHTSILSGEQWVKELLDGHNERFYDEMGMHQTVFKDLLALLKADGGLSDSRYVTAQEQLATFLYYARQGLSNWALQERFQRSEDMISK